MEVLKEISDWVTISNFKPDNIPQESLDRIVSAAQRAPSAKNRQPWRLVAVRKTDVREKIYSAAYMEEHVGKAPVIIAVCTTNVDYKMPNGQLAYPIDIGISLAFMMVQARAEGLGAHTITTYDEERVRQILTVPYQMRVVALLLLGYAEETPLQRERRPLDQLLSYDHW
ncbi:MAG: nitroreductase family protein [Spirochaetia bacterium]|nr:nitroreductase family protein [Spirochaetia bacterium]